MERLASTYRLLITGTSNYLVWLQLNTWLPLPPSWSPVIAADPLSKFESSRTSSNNSDNQVLSSFRLLLPTNLLYNSTRLSGGLLKDLVRYRSKSSTCSYLKLSVYRYGFIGIQREIDSPKTWPLWNSRTFKLGVSSDGYKLSHSLTISPWPHRLKQLFDFEGEIADGHHVSPNTCVLHFTDNRWLEGGKQGFSQAITPMIRRIRILDPEN